MSKDNNSYVTATASEIVLSNSVYRRIRWMKYLWKYTTVVLPRDGISITREETLQFSSPMSSGSLSQRNPQNPLTLRIYIHRTRSILNQTSRNNMISNIINAGLQNSWRELQHCELKFYRTRIRKWFVLDCITDELSSSQFIMPNAYESVKWKLA